MQRHVGEEGEETASGVLTFFASRSRAGDGRRPRAVFVIIKIKELLKLRDYLLPPSHKNYLSSIQKLSLSLESTTYHINHF